MSVPDHKLRLSEIGAAVPRRYRGWLNAKLSYSNERIFRSRLLELAERTGEAGWIVLLGGWLNLAMDTRNYLTHYDERLSAKAASGLMLRKLTSSLKALLAMCLLQEAGVPPDKLRDAAASLPQRIDIGFY